MFLLTETLRFLVATAAIDDGNNFSLTHMRTCAIWFGACFDDCPLKMPSSHNCTAFTSHSLRNEHVCQIRFYKDILHVRINYTCIEGFV
ncbi:unnamed protein product [Rhizophagus irregularis]|nr:unnamed protein product [Rhizophagus irregularis]